jgi:hypothetical protein
MHGMIISNIRMVLLEEMDMESLAAMGFILIRKKIKTMRGGRLDCRLSLCKWFSDGLYWLTKK